MTDGGGITRRTFLGGSAALAGPGAALARLLAGCAPAGPDCEAIRALFPDPESVARIGRACLAARADAPDRPSLCRVASRALARTGEGEPVSALRARVRQDFQAGRTVRVEGWVISEIEATVAAIYALAERSA